MTVNLILIGRNALFSHYNFERLSTLLADKDCRIDNICFFDEDKEIILPEGDGLFILCGDCSDFLSKQDAIEEDDGVFSVQNKKLLPIMALDDLTIKNVILPVATRDVRPTRNTIIFRIYGKEYDETFETVSKIIKNRNKIDFSLRQNGKESELRIRYVKNIQSLVINDVINKIREAFLDHIYAMKDASLAKSVAHALMVSGKKIALAESFTGGGIASSLISFPGMSKTLLESIVCYSNDSKMSRLNVPKSVLDRNGPISADTAFEMASGLLMETKCDIAVSTTGNAGPTAENGGPVGLFFVAIGDREAVHVFRQHYEVKNADKKSVDDIRKEITEAGISYALFELGRYLKNI